MTTLLDQSMDSLLSGYIEALKKHDWSYEMSDDHAAWIRGSNERSRLNRMQRELDADFAIWNEHAPTLYRMRPDLTRACDERAMSREVRA